MTDTAADARLPESPRRAELFSVSQLERHARTIAGWHELAVVPGREDWLLARLGDNAVALRDAYTLVTDAVQRGRQITPAAEWFIDNYHLIEEQIRTARRHLPRAYHRDRLEVLGRNGSHVQPACMQRARLSGRVGAGLDPCFAMRVMLELADGQEREIAFTFGSGRDLADARHLVTRFRGTEPARIAECSTWAHIVGLDRSFDYSEVWISDDGKDVRSGRPAKPDAPLGSERWSVAEAQARMFLRAASQIATTAGFLILRSTEIA